MLLDTSCYSKHLESYFKPISTEIQKWMEAPYEKNSKHPENLKHISLFGHKVRSKSESLIDLCLQNYNIPFRYECALHLDEYTFYPDFMIWSPRDNCIIYWEHFGMMDDAKYANHVFNKLQIFSQYGYIPTINLITTFETKENPLTYDMVENVIKMYLL